MPNPNPSDLDREALLPCPFCGGTPSTEYHYDGMDIYGVGCGGHAGFNGETLKEAADKWNKRALPPASGVPEAEAVVWRYKPRSGGEWEYFAGTWREPWNEKWIGEPLYASPPPVAAPSGETELRQAMQEAIDLLLEKKHGNPARSASHNARVCLQFALTGDVISLIASKPKDAGSGEGPLTKEEQVYSLDDALIWEDDRVNLNLQETIEQLNAAGFSITRTVPSRAKP